MIILSKVNRRVPLFLFIVSLFTGAGTTLLAQEFPNALEITETVVDYNTKAKLEGVSVQILEKRDDGTFEEYARDVTTKKAFITSQLYLQKEYIIVFQKKGYIKKKILIDTRMDGIDEDFYEHDNILYLTNKIVLGEEDPSLLDKPVVRVYFSKMAKGFVFDSLYVAKIKTEIAAMPKDLLEGLVKVQEKNAQAEVVSDPLEEARRKKEMDDLIAKAAAIAQAKIDQARLDSLKLVQQVIDSIAAVNAQVLAQQVADSLKNIALENAKIALAKRIKDSTDRANRPVASIITRTNVPGVIAPTVAPGPGDELLIVGKVPELIMKFQDEVFTDKTQTISESNTTKAVKLAIEKEKMDNMNAKYKTGSPFISLLDEIDFYAKAQKNKTSKP